MRFELIMSSIFVIVIEYVVIIRFLTHFLTLRHFSKLTRMLLFTVCAIVFTPALFSVNQVGVPALNTACCFLLILIISAILFSDQIVKKIAFSTIYIAISAASELCFTFIYSIVVSTTPAYTIHNDILYVAGGLVGKAILIAIVIMICRIFPGKYDTETPKSLLLLSSFPALGVASMLVYLNATMHDVFSLIENMLVILMVLGVLASGIAIFFVFDSEMKRHVLEAELTIQREQQKMNDRVLIEQRKHIEVRNRIIHNFKNDLTNLNNLRERSPHEATKYSDNLVAQFSEMLTSSYFNTGNAVIDTILNKTEIECRENNIRFQCDIQFGDLSFLSNLDASMIFDNIMDNALAACIRVDEANRWLHLQIKRSYNFILIVISNSKCNEIQQSNGKFLSSRRNYRQSGLGIASVEEAVRKYQGECLISYDNRSFTMTIHLPYSPDNTDILNQHQ